MTQHATTATHSHLRQKRGGAGEFWREKREEHINRKKEIAKVVAREYMS